ncbi:MAG: hypothetical protein GX780_03480, partial [Campylobacteraceae bacterium]|nr:hypothetical protein [Campylobacteraceae bacterium]
MSGVVVPDGWEIKQVSSLCKILDNLRIPLNDEERQNMKGHIPYYGANTIVDYINDYIFDEDLILLAEDGGNFDEYEKKPIAFKITGKSWINNHAHVLKPNSNVEFNYLFYSLEHKNITSYIRGGTRSKLNQSDLKTIEVLIPKEKKEQEKIAKILSTLDKNIENTSKIIEKEKNIKKALMQELLTNGIDQNGQIRSPETHTYKQSKLGLIPDEWEVVDFLKAINLIDGDRGTNYPKDEDFSEHGYCVFLSAKNVTKDGFRFNEIQFITKDKDEQLRKGKLVKNDTVLTTRGTVGNIAYFDESVIFKNMRINSGMII